MNTIENKIGDLHIYQPDRTKERHEIDEFWKRQLDRFSERYLSVKRRPEPTYMTGVRVYEVTYCGLDETPLFAWYLTPETKKDESHPCIVMYQGYTNGRGFPERYAQWVLMGYSVLAVDARGQAGQTGNLLGSEHGMTKGWVTQGIQDKENSYYMALIADSLKAIEAAAAQPETDASRIAVYGGSQGGGLAMAAAALSPIPCCAVADIPNMCHMDLGLQESVGSLSEIAEYANLHPERLPLILDNLSYFDNMNLAHRIKIPIMVSVGLKDEVCLPRTIFAAYNRIESEKEIRVYPFLSHRVTETQQREGATFLSLYLGGPELQ